MALMIYETARKSKVVVDKETKEVKSKSSSSYPWEEVGPDEARRMLADRYGGQLVPYLLGRMDHGRSVDLGWGYIRLKM